MTKEIVDRQCSRRLCCHEYVTASSSWTCTGPFQVEKHCSSSWQLERMDYVTVARALSQV